jgi:hypothetical protein
MELDGDASTLKISGSLSGETRVDIDATTLDLDMGIAEDKVDVSLNCSASGVRLGGEDHNGLEFTYQVPAASGDAVGKLILDADAATVDVRFGE